LVSSILTSPELGLTQCKNDPCVFVGCPLPGQPPLYLILYVVDFVYFSPSADVESYFESALKQHMNVDFLSDAELFLGIQFSWHFLASGELSCRLSQEGYIQSIVSELAHANTFPTITPFHSGFPVIQFLILIYLIQTENLSLIKCIVGWVCLIGYQGTRPDTLGTNLPDVGKAT
jgi:hypothetical protein